MDANSKKAVAALFNRLMSSDIIQHLAIQHRVLAADTDRENNKDELHAAELLELTASRLRDIGK